MEVETELKKIDKNQFLQLCIIFSLFLNVILLSVSFPNKISSDPPVTGDWIVDDTSTVSGQTLVMNGSIVIAATGSLTVTDSTIIFAGNAGAVSNGDWNITVNDGGSLSITNSKLTTDDPSYTSNLRFNGSSLTIEGTTFEHFSYGSAIHILGGEAQITDSNITMSTDNTAAIYGRDTNNIVIEDTVINTLVGVSGYGIWLLNCNHSSIINNNVTLLGSGLGIGVDNSHHIEIIDNYAFVSFNFGAIYVKNHCTDVLIENNTAYGNNSGAVPIWIRPGANYVPEDIHIIGNTICQISTGTFAGIVVHSLSSIIGTPRNIEIRNNEIITETFGIQIQKSAELTITDNIIHTDGHCIHVLNQTDGDLTVSGNILSAEGSDCILIESSYDGTGEVIPTISENIIDSANGDGIHVIHLPTVEVSRNTISKIDNNAIYVYYSENSQIHHNTISDTIAFGIRLYVSPDSIISSNIISEIGEDGIYTSHSSNSNIEGNIIERCNDDGIAFGFFEDNVTVVSNIVTDIHDWALFTYTGLDCHVEGNILRNAQYGLYISSTASDLTFTGNQIESMSMYGFYTALAVNTGFSFSRNTFLKNNVGLYIQGDDNSIFNNSFVENDLAIQFTVDSSDSVIYFNDFVDNLIQVDDGGTNNQWYYEITGTEYGNYWSDYTGIDANGDGIGDTPYNITNDGLIQDIAPLVKAGSLETPSISHPADILMLTGTSGVIITWNATTMAPHQYTIAVNGSTVTTNLFWDGSLIAYTVSSDLAEGNHTITCTITDSLGRTAVDEVQVRVLPPSAINPPTPEDTTTPTIPTTAESESGDTSPSPGLDLTSTAIGAIGGIVIIGALFLVTKVIRRGKS
jgi:parallel beta-helix repeat protein